MAARISISDLFEKNLYDNDRAIIVKNLPEHISQDGIENFIEVVTERCLESYCYSSIVGQGNVLVAVLGKDIKDITQIRDKPFEGRQVHFAHLGDVGGIVVADIGTVFQDTVELYFDNPKRSGGKEDTVTKVEVHQLDNKLTALVTICDEEAISSILARAEHKIGSQKLVIEPYFPTFHDPLLQYIKQLKQTTNSLLEKEIHGRNAPGDVKIRERCEASVGEDIQQTEEGKAKNAVSIEPRHIERKQYLPMQQKYTPPMPERSIKEEEPILQSYPSLNKLRIFVDEKEEGIHTPSDEPSKDDSAREGHITQPDHTSNRPVRKRHASGKGKHNENARSSKPDNTVEEHNDNTDKTVVEHLKNISKRKIVLLRIGCFQRKCRESSIDVDIIYLETQNTVTLKGSSKQHITECLLMMHEILNQVKQKSVKISPPERVAYLARTGIQSFLRNKSKSKKINAVYEMNTDCSELVCFAYKEETLNNGLDLVDGLFKTQTIALREGQNQLLQSQEWVDCRTKNGTDLIAIYETNDSIVIEAICTIKIEVIRDMRTAITEFLKAYTPKQKTEIEVYGGRAKYFQKYCQKDLEDRLRHKHVKVHTKITQESSQIRLLMSVEGDKRFFQEVDEEVRNIWHKDIDFRKIASEDCDIWLIMRSLDGDIGRQFFRHFQHDHKCIIQVVKDGQIKPPPVRITKDVDIKTGDALTYRAHTHGSGDQDRGQRKRIHKGYARNDSNSEDTDDELRNFKQTANMDNSDVSGVESNDDASEAITHTQFWNAGGLHSYDRYQAGMTEHEATAHALQASFEESEQGFREGLYGDEFSAFGNPVTPRLQYRHTHVVKEETAEVTIGNTRIILVKGQITEQKADALVNIVDPSGEIQGQSIVSRAFVKVAGAQLVQLYQDKINQFDQRANFEMNFLQRVNTSQYNHITLTEGVVNLRCSGVIHTKLVKNNVEVLSQVMREIYQECRSNGYTTVAMPPLGVGRLYQYSEKEVASLMLSGTIEFLQQSASQLQEVYFVVYRGDSDTYDAFDNAFNKYKANPLLVNSTERYTTQLSQRGVTSRLPQRVEPVLKQIPERNRGIVMPSSRVRLCTVQNRKTSAHPGQNEYERRSSHDHFSRGKPELYNKIKMRHDRESSIEIRKRQIREQQQEAIYQTSRVFPQPRVPTSRNPNSDGERAQRHDGSQRRPGRPVRRGGHGEDRARSKSRERPSSGQGGYNHGQKILNKESKYKKKAARQSRFSDQQPSSKLTVTVFAGNKVACEQARNILGKEIKKEFLHQIDLERREIVSTDAKKKIVNVIERHKVKSLKVNGKYKLIGYKDSVRKANEEILKVLLEDKPVDKQSERKRRRSKVTRATVEFSQCMATEEAEVPWYWKFKPGQTLKTIMVDFKHLLLNKKFEKEPLDVNGHTYSTIIRLINETFQADSEKIGQGKDATGIQTYRQFFVHEICRIENPQLYREYAYKRSELFGKLSRRENGYFSKLDKLKGGEKLPRTSAVIKDKELGADVYEEVNECYFFHGTKRENIDKICSDGLDARLCSPEAMFGQGIYGAESVIKADQYTDSKTARTGGPKKMFLMRMLLGDIFVCQEANPHKYKRAPCTKCYLDNCVDSKHHYHFDSVVGGAKKLFREFVVYDSKQCYPEYVITYERK